jgi:Zn-dependent M28 family amino/carboxypeptidase
VPDGPVEVEDSEVVFVGYGIVAPEYGWDDYAGLDVTGKTVVMLVNDPGYATGDEALFRGRTMTYYGRYTYKYEEAARQGAAAAFVVHEVGAAGYPWTVVVRSWGGASFGLDSGGAPGPTAIHGWITRDAATRVLGAAGHDLGALEARAAQRGARPVPSGIEGSFGLVNRSKRSLSKNVVGVLRGAERPDEYVLYTAHWDHLGNKPGAGKDTIYNGALDNATGTAALLELAEAFGARERPARSVLFLAVTAEESGLLGSQWYAEHPLYPLERTVAGINMDGLNVYGPMEDIVVVGRGASELDRYLADAATAQGRTLSNEPTPEKGYYYRSDHFNFAKHGVPMLFTAGGSVSRAHGRAWVQERETEYLTQRYHQPTDEYDPATFDMHGAAEDVRLFEAVGRRIAGEGRWVAWSAGNEFEATRAASVEQRR